MTEDIIDETMGCINCGAEVVCSYVHFGETKVHCKKCDLFFIYNNGNPFNTIEVVDKNYYESQEVKRKTREQLLYDIDQEFEQCCINVFDLLQKNESTLTDAEILSFADESYRKLHIQNSKVIVTGDGK